MTSIITITRQRVSDHQRITHTDNLFGIHFPLKLEPFVYAITGHISRDYHGGYWEFYSLSNGGFYMAPSGVEKRFHVSCENGYEGQLSADALGITACLYTYSHLSFGDSPLTLDALFVETCTQQYHWLREYVFEHTEVRDILKAID